MPARGSFHYSTLDEAHALAEFLGKACPDPQRATQGLLELFVNAVEHGNLGITYAEKGELVMRGEWQQEVDRRLRQAEYVGRRVEVDCERHATHLRITIRDQGQGFDWSGYLDFDPERAFHLHGRGIAMARRMCFEHLEYQGSGNVVVVEVASPAGSMQPA